MSTISAGTTSGTALVSSGDTTGQLVLQTNGNTTAVTIGTNQVVSLTQPLPVGSGGTGVTSLTANNVLLGNGTSAVQVVAPGASGNVLTSNGTTWTSATPSTAGGGGTTATGNVTLTNTSPGAQSVTPAGFGGFVKLPDATTMTKAAINFNIRNAGDFPLKIIDNASNILGFIYPKTSASVGCADNSTAAGVWVVEGTEPIGYVMSYLNTSIRYTMPAACFALDDGRQFLLWQEFSTTALYAVVYDSNTGTFGSATLVASLANATGTAAAAIKLTANSVLVAYTYAGAIGRVLSISGTTITVNAASSAATSSANVSYPSLTLIGSTYIFDKVTNGSSGYIHAITVSGTTVTVGTEVAVTGSMHSIDYSPGVPTVYQVTSTSFVRFSFTITTAVYAQAFSISGTTITAGTLLTIATTSSFSNRFKSFVVGSQWAMVYINSSQQPVVSIISVAGTTCTASTAIAITDTVNQVNAFEAVASGNKVIVAALTGTSIWSICFGVVTNSSGTASAGTQLKDSQNGSNGYDNLTSFTAVNNIATFGVRGQILTTNVFVMYCIDFSGSSPAWSASPRFNNVQPNGTNYNSTLISSVRNQFCRAIAMVGSASSPTTGTLYSFQNRINQYNGYPIFATSGANFNLPYLSFAPATGSGTWFSGISNYETWWINSFDPNTTPVIGTVAYKAECAQV